MIRQPGPLENPTDWKTFRSAFTFYMMAMEKEKKAEKTKVSLLISCLGAKYIKVYNMFEFSDSVELKDVLAKFEEYFIPQVNIVYKRYKFWNRRQ